MDWEYYYMLTSGITTSGIIANKINTYDRYYC